MSKKKRKQQKQDVPFARYAAKYWRELEAVFALESIEVQSYGRKEARDVAQDVLAKQLYSFADYVTRNTIFTFAKDIPDLPKDDDA